MQFLRGPVGNIWARTLWAQCHIYITVGVPLKQPELRLLINKPPLIVQSLSEVLNSIVIVLQLSSRNTPFHITRHLSLLRRTRG